MLVYADRVCETKYGCELNEEGEYRGKREGYRPGALWCAVIKLTQSWCARIV